MSVGFTGLRPVDGDTVTTHGLFRTVILLINATLRAGKMVPRKLQVSETFHSISKSRNGICDESKSLVFVSFLESQSFEFLQT